MKTYWDHSDKERCQLTDEQVRSMLDMELMEKGVLKVAAPMLKDIKEIDIPKRMYFCVGEVVFENVELAGKFLELSPATKDYDYSVGYDYFYAKLVDTEIKQVMIYDRQSLLNLGSLIRENAAAKKYNTEVTQAYEKAAKTMEDTLSGIWDDWHRCRSLDYGHKEILRTLEHYKSIADGNVEVAMKFLEKVFSKEKIDAAIAW